MHTTPVTATSDAVGEGKAKWWLLVFGSPKTSDRESVQGVAAEKSSELLGRQPKTQTAAAVMLAARLCLPS